MLLRCIYCTLWYSLIIFCTHCLCHDASFVFLCIWSFNRTRRTYHWKAIIKPIRLNLARNFRNHSHRYYIFSPVYLLLLYKYIHLVSFFAPNYFRRFLIALLTLSTIYSYLWLLMFALPPNFKHNINSTLHSLLRICLSLLLWFHSRVGRQSIHGSTNMSLNKIEWYVTKWNKVIWYDHNKNYLVSRVYTRGWAHNPLLILSQLLTLVTRYSILLSHTFIHFMRIGHNTSIQFEYLVAAIVTIYHNSRNWTVYQVFRWKWL